MSNVKDLMAFEHRITATPLQILKFGIEQGRWDAVKYVHKLLSGEDANLISSHPALDMVEEDKAIQLKPADVIRPSIKEVEHPKKKRGRPVKKKVVVDEVLEESPGITTVAKAAPSIMDVTTAPAKLEDVGKVKASFKKHDITKRNIDKVNKFKDDLEEASAEIIKDRKVSPHKQKPPIKFFKAKCSQCHKTETVDEGSLPPIIPGNKGVRYKCNECSISGSESGSALEEVEGFDGESET